MLIFRKAILEDALAIAKLHARSWQENYRIVFSDDYLDHQVLPNRIKVWKERLENPAKNQYVILVEEKGVLLGFVCAYLDQDTVYGTYLDNLHVSSSAQRSGIGTKLMAQLANELKSISEQGIYLWVIEGNAMAIQFYDAIEGKALDKVEADDVGDALFIKIRYVWDSLSALHKVVTTKINAYEH